MARARRKRRPVARRRVRPESVTAQFRDIRAFMASKALDARSEREHAEWSDDSPANLPLVALCYGPQVWPDDPDVSRELADDLATLGDYREMLAEPGSGRSP